MEKRLNQRIEKYLTEFKDGLKTIDASFLTTV